MKIIETPEYLKRQTMGIIRSAYEKNLPPVIKRELAETWTKLEAMDLVHSDPDTAMVVIRVMRARLIEIISKL